MSGNIEFLDLPENIEYANKDELISIKKRINDLIKTSRNKIKQGKCIYCEEKCNSFCNSHTVPAFCLRNIAENGKVKNLNHILNIDVAEKEKGVNNAGVFQIICRECDSKIFQEYENPNSYFEKPSSKMLIEIELKNKLKDIYDKRMVINLFRNLLNNFENSGEIYYENIAEIISQINVNEIDCNEYIDELKKIKNNIKTNTLDYKLGFYIKLPYVVPVAYQGSIGLVIDIKNNLLNDIYNEDPNYKIKEVNLCIFPMEETTSIFMFVSKENNIYDKFFEQLNAVESLEERLSYINFILFAYTEDYFLSPKISDTIENKLKSCAKINSVISYDLECNLNTIEEERELKKQYDYNKRKNIPNILSEKFKIN